MIDTYTIYEYSSCRYNYTKSSEFNTCRLGLSRKLFKAKIFEICSVIIEKYVDINYNYFNTRDLEKLLRIIQKSLKIDYRNEKDAMRRIKALIYFSKID